MLRPHHPAGQGSRRDRHSTGGRAPGRIETARGGQHPAHRRLNRNSRSSTTRSTTRPRTPRRPSADGHSTAHHTGRSPLLSSGGPARRVARRPRPARKQDTSRPDPPAAHPPRPAHPLHLLSWPGRRKEGAPRADVRPPPRTKPRDDLQLCRSRQGRERTVAGEVVGGGTGPVAGGIVAS